MDHGTKNPALSGSVCKSGDFDFVIDMSGSIGAQGNLPSNLQQLKDGINGFVNAFQGAGGDGIYAGTSSAAARPRTSPAATVGRDVPDRGQRPQRTVRPDADRDRHHHRRRQQRRRPSRRAERHVRPDRRLAQQAEHPQRRPEQSPRRGSRARTAPSVPPTPLGPRATSSRPSTSARRRTRATPACRSATRATPPGRPRSWTRSAAADHFDSDFNGFVDDLFAAIDCPPPPPAHLTIAKTANPVGPVAVGSPIGFDITIANTGQGAATDVTISDPLPAGNALDWSLSPAFPGCSISGAVGNEQPRLLVRQPRCRRDARVPSTSSATPPRASAGRSTTAPRSTRPMTIPVSNGAYGRREVPGHLRRQDTRQRLGQCRLRTRSSRSSSATPDPRPPPAVVVTDNLPAGYTWTAGGADGAACSINTAPEPGRPDLHLRIDRGRGQQTRSP